MGKIVSREFVDFDKRINRLSTDCVKYDGIAEYFGTSEAKPLWVADMDFATPKHVQSSIKNKLKQQIFGYEIPSLKSFDAVINWQKRHNIELRKENILFCSGVVPSLKVAIDTFTHVGDEVIIFPPVYFPFFSVIKDNNRVIIESKLELQNGQYIMNLVDLESKISSKTKLLLLCSPHNPIGKIWNKDELEALNTLCVRNNILVVSDEIHSDLVFKKFISFASLNKDCLILNAPSKTFNVAGLNTSYVFSKNNEILAQFKIYAKRNHITSLNSLSNTLIQSCYSDESEIWLKELLTYLQENINYTNTFFSKYIPKIKIIETNATYLLWLDFKETGLKHKEIKNKLLSEAKLALNDGITFGSNGKYFFRLNIALPKSELKKVLVNIREVFSIK